MTSFERPARAGSLPRTLALLAFAAALAACTAGAADRAPAAPPGSAPEEITLAVTRVFAGAAGLEREPAYLSADLNGDGAQDLAVVVRPSPGHLSEINHDLANWILEDPLAPPDSPRARVEAGDRLLAIIHGYGPAGWRSGQARQTYLLRNAAPIDMVRLPAASVIDPGPGRKVVGDVLAGTLGGKRGFLFWTGAKYRWHEQEGMPAGPSSLTR